jgi:cytochrome c oxidase assembly factor CtaG
MAAVTAPPAPTWPLVLARWSIEPAVVVLLAVAAVVYLRRKGPRPGLFVAGLAVVAVALLSPIATYAEGLLSVHMVQHLLLVLVAAPLLVAAFPGSRRPRPLLAWTAFAAAGWVVHFSPLFDLALRRPPVHAFEHVLFLGSGLLFWAPVLGAPDVGLSYPARLLYLALAMPQNTFLALAIFSADHPLYPAYVRQGRAWGSSVLADQRLGGGIMWVAGDVTLLVAVLVVAAAWATHSAGEELDLNAAPAVADQYKHGDNAP